MSYEFNNFNDIHEPPEPRRSRLKLVIYLLVVLAIIMGLFWSAISGVAWMIGQIRTETAVATPTPPLTIPSTPFPTPDPALAVNRIAFINPDGQVETIAPDGEERRLISSETSPLQFPAWSPDGQFVAATGGGGVYNLTDSPEIEVRELYANRGQRPFYLYWSPDGRNLAFLANHPRGIGLYLSPADGAEESRLLEIGSPFYWDWTADSSQILMHAGITGEEARLALLDVASGRGAPNAAIPGLFQAPDISADDRYWAYAELDGNGLSWLVAADTVSGAVQSQRHAGQTALSWSPVANQLAFTSGGEGRLDFAGPLRLMDAETGETRLLSRETVLAFFWSPDGRYLAAIVGDEEQEGVIASGDGRRHSGKSARQFHPPISLNLILIDAATG
ncbi:MAG: hypothetical protein GY803_04385, partial [Chloroflexi bacterium]|nr:hypothetical protein [Chloroflexota bacterium]